MTHSLRIPHTLTVDYTQIDQPRIVLHVERELGRNWIAVDNNDTVYARHPDLNVIVGWMRTAAERDGLIVDERSIELERERLARRARRAALPALAPVIPIRKDVA